MQKIPKQESAAEFKAQAVKRVKEDKSVAAVAREMGLVEQRLRNWVQGVAAGHLNGAGAPSITLEQMELAPEAGERHPANSGGGRREGCAVKDAWIDAHRKPFDLNALCLDVNVCGDRAWKGGGTADRHGVTDAQLLALLQAIHGEMKGTYGRPQMVRERRARDVSVSNARGKRLMHENGLQGRHQRRYKATTDSCPALPCP